MSITLDQRQGLYFIIEFILNIILIIKIVL